mgnify:CR=1 FL=1
MIDPELAQKVLKELYFPGLQYAELFAEHTTDCAIRLEEQRVEKLLQSAEVGVGLRVIHGGRTAYAYGNDLSPRGLLGLARTLLAALRQAPQEAELHLGLSQRPPKAHLAIEEDPQAVELSRKVALLKEADEAAREESPLVSQVGVNYRDYTQRVFIASWEGFWVEDERRQCLLAVQVVAQKDGVLQSSYEPVGGTRGFELFRTHPPHELARKAARRAALMLRAPRAPGGRMAVVLSSQAGGTMIHEAVGHGLEADLAQEGLSVYSGKLGQKVASELITVLDDATLKGQRGSLVFDDEGTPGQRTVLIQEGVLLSYMHDRLSALKAGAQPTGNGRRQSYRHRPIPRMTNTLIAPGSTEPEEIIRATPKGLLVKKMGGGQVNTVSGDFVFYAEEAYIIEGGRVGEPVRGATLCGNGPQVLREIDMVGSDLGFSIGTCGKDAQGVPVADAQPTLRVPQLVVGGAL